MPGPTISQLTDVIALARAIPQGTIVICHVGGVLGYGTYTGKKDEIHAEWRASNRRIG
jgi:L-fuconolactonase